jgi:hypothetical protein
MGSSLLNSAGSWLSGNYEGVTGGVQFVTNAGATFYITGVQLEAGTVATPFEYRNYQQELAMCQRYYESSSSSLFLAMLSTDTSYRCAGASFAVTKRTTPTMVFSGGSLTTTPGIGVNGWSFASNGFSGSSGYAAGTWTASAEL